MKYRLVSEGEADGSPTSEPPSGDSGPTDIAALARDDWRAALAATREITGPITDAIIDAHGDRGQRAIEAVSELRVKQYRDFTVVVGHHDEHVVENGGCDCADAAYNLDPDDPEQRCWHALAVDIAERVDAVDHHDMWYSEVREFL
jgi:predicted nucleic acid-binding Zn finger protein